MSRWTANCSARQARRYGFDEQEYLAALDAVPRLSRQSVDTGMAFFMKLARMLSQLSYGNIQLARSLEERNCLMESLHQSGERLSRAQEIAHLGSWELDLVNGALTWSDEVYRIFGLQPQEFGATYESFLEAVYPDDRAAVDSAYSDSLREGKSSYEIEHRIVRRGTGEIRWVHEKCQHVRDASGKVIRSAGMVLDVTSRRRQEQHLRQLNRTLQALGNSSQALMHATEEGAYMEEVCRIIACDGGYAMAWIGFAEEDENKTVRPVVSAGFAEGYLDTLNVTWADTERGCGPTGTAIRTGQVQICRDMLSDPAFSPWRKEAIKRGYAASIALPLLEAGKVFGVLTIYAPEPDPFTEDDVRLLTELAGDLSFGITSLRLRAAKDQAARALARSEERFRLLSETAGRLLAEENPQGIVNTLCRKVMEHLDCQVFFNFLVDAQVGRLHLNACAGISDEEARQIEWLDSGVAVCGCVARDGARLVAEDIPAHPDPRTDLVASYGIRAYACHPLLAEGRVLGTLSFGTRTRTHFRADDLSLMKTVADQVAVAIERIQAQRALRESEAQLQAVVENLDEGVVVADLEGRLLHWNRAALEMHGFASLNECRRRLPELAGTFELSTLDGTVLSVEQWPLARILRGEALRDWEVRVRRLDDGIQRIFNYGGMLVRDARGQPFMAVVTVGDITERKRGEAEREHHLDLHVKLVRITQDILDAADLPGVLQKVADASVELTDARLGASGHGFADGRPHVRTVSRGGGRPRVKWRAGLPWSKAACIWISCARANPSVSRTNNCTPIPPGGVCRKGTCLFVACWAPDWSMPTGGRTA